MKLWFIIAGIGALILLSKNRGGPTASFFSGAWATPTLPRTPTSTVGPLASPTIDIVSQVRPPDPFGPPVAAYNPSNQSWYVNSVVPAGPNA
jgi:hypothetical protein